MNHTYYLPSRPKPGFLRIWLYLMLSFGAFKAFAQVTCVPVFPNPDDNVTITFDATQGNGALARGECPGP